MTALSNCRLMYRALTLDEFADERRQEAYASSDPQYLTVPL